MTKLVLAPKTEQRITNFINNPAQAVLIVGLKGIGKTSVAEQIGSQVLNEADLSTYPHFLRIDFSSQSPVGIDNIRSLERFLSLKVLGKKPIDRLVLIEQADLLGLEAQNALLKLLEEPPAKSLMILTASDQSRLLPTIVSRLAIVQLAKPTKQALAAHFKEASPEIFSPAYALSGGLPGLLNDLLSDVDHPLNKATIEARKILSSSTFDRLAQVDSLAKDRELAVDLIYVLEQMAQLSLASINTQTQNSWQNVLEASYKAEQAISKNVQLKLILTDLMLNLSS